MRYDVEKAMAPATVQRGGGGDGLMKVAIHQRARVLANTCKQTYEQTQRAPSQTHTHKYHLTVQQAAAYPLAEAVRSHPESHCNIHISQRKKSAGKWFNVTYRRQL